MFRRLDDHWGSRRSGTTSARHRTGRLADALTSYEVALTDGRLVGPANTVRYLPFPG